MHKRSELSKTVVIKPIPSDWYWYPPVPASKAPIYVFDTEERKLYDVSARLVEECPHRYKAGKKHFCELAEGNLCIGCDEQFDPIKCLLYERKPK